MGHDYCKICGNQEGNRIHRVREMMLGIGDYHQYVECDACGCIQIMDIPADMQRYYGEEYYSYRNQPAKRDNVLASWLRTRWIGASYQSGGALGTVLKTILGHKKTSYGYCFEGLDIRFDSRILDVGSGAGDFVFRLMRDGFQNVLGVDYYVPRDIWKDEKLIVQKAEIHELTNPYDLIMFNNSFEHMDDQVRVIKKAYELLSTGGWLVIIIPLCDSFAFRKYGKNWVQWDAPRHFYLHSQKSINLLCKNHGFELFNIVYNSSHFQFEGSEMYLRGFNLQGAPNAKSLLKKRDQFAEAAKRLNSINDGDSACFIFEKTASRQ